jgi:chromosome segregation ATPase
MRSAKERLEGNSYGVADPGLHALAEAIDELAGRVDHLDEWLGESIGQLGRTTQGLLELRSRDEALADHLDNQDLASKLTRVDRIESKIKSLHSRLEDVEKGQDLQDSHMNDLRDAAETAKADAEKALERLVAHAKTHQQLRQAIEDIEHELGQRADEDFQSQPETNEGLNSTGIHEHLAEDIRAVFPNADIAVRRSDEQPGLDVEFEGVNYFVRPNRSVEERTDGWKLKRTHRAWLVEQMLKFLERRASEQ